MAFNNILKFLIYSCLLISCKADNYDTEIAASETDRDSYGEENESYRVEFRSLSSAYTTDTRLQPNAEALRRAKRLAKTKEGCNTKSYPPKIFSKLGSLGNFIKGETKGRKWDLTGDSSMSTDVDSDTYTFDLTFSVKRASSRTVKNRSQDKAKGMSGTSIFPLIDQEKVTETIDITEIDSICTILMAQKFNQKTRDGDYTKVDFDRPTPVLINPKASEERFLLEVGEGLLFDDLKADIETNDENVSKNKYTSSVGKIEVYPIKPKNSIIDDAGKTHDLDADYGFRIKTDFTDPSGKKSKVSWLNKTTDYYVKDGNITTVVVETNSDLISIMVYK